MPPQHSRVHFWRCFSSYADIAGKTYSYLNTASLTMAEPTPRDIPGVTEGTFSKYTAAQASHYTQARRNYHQSVYDFIITSHTSTGGILDNVLDIGCGPGLATRTLATYFKHATGLDPSPGMIQEAQTLGGHTVSGEGIQYGVSSAEVMDGAADSSVDLITAANTAHWFSSMQHFWARAAQVLRPGGTVAIWTSGGARMHPAMPNAVKIQAAIDRVTDEGLAPYRNEGNVMTRNRYVDLELPWNCHPAVQDFEQASFVRRQWTPEETFLGGPGADGEAVPLSIIGKMYGTSSQVTRWREAHPELANTKDDVIVKLVEEIGGLLREVGVKAGEEKVSGVVEGVVLIFKKKE